MGVRKTVTAAIVSALFLTWGVLAAQPAIQEPGAVSSPGAFIRLERCKTLWADERIISSKIPGKIDYRLVRDGDEVSEGQDLAILDSRDAQIELAIQEILGNSDLDEKTQREKLQEYITRLEIASKLVPSRVISEEEYRLAKVNVNVNKLMTLKEVEKRSIEQKKAERARIYLSDHVIKSPIHGMIKKCFKREKESVAASDLQLFHIVATDKVWVEGLAPVSELFRVKVGNNVEVKLDLRSINDDGRLPISASLQSRSFERERVQATRNELPQEKVKFPGKIIFIHPDADFSNGVFQVRAEVDNQPDPVSGGPILRAGLNTSMTIFLGN
jgi:multidrug efflux pump subunit AcrA (membrane-fusion protein)